MLPIYLPLWIHDGIPLGSQEYHCLVDLEMYHPSTFMIIFKEGRIFRNLVQKKALIHLCLLKSSFHGRPDPFLYHLLNFSFSNLLTIWGFSSTPTLLKIWSLRSYLVNEYLVDSKKNSIHFISSSELEHSEKVWICLILMDSNLIQGSFAILFNVESLISNFRIISVFVIFWFSSWWFI